MIINVSFVVVGCDLRRTYNFVNLTFDSTRLSLSLCSFPFWSFFEVSINVFLESFVRDYLVQDISYCNE